MTIVSNDPSWWPTIHANIFYSYFIVASSAAVIYDWGLTFGQEVELIWKQRWSLMTVVYLIARYVAIGFSVIQILPSVTTISMTDTLSIPRWSLPFPSNQLNYHVGVSLIMYEALACMGDVVDIMLGVMVAIQLMHTSGEELVLSGNFSCIINIAGDSLFMHPTTWILGIVWEVLALCLAVWIAVKHFRDLRQHSSGGIIGDCFMMLIQTHVSYFASFVVFACLYIGRLSPMLSAHESSLDVQIYDGFAQILYMVQLSVLGPRLILSVREYYAKLVADSGTTTAMTSIVFQECVHVETSCSV